MRIATVGLAVAAVALLGAAPATGLALSSHYSWGPGYYLRATDLVLGPCHVTDDSEASSWTGSLGPGESFTTAEWFCGPTDESVLPGHVDEGSDEDFGFALSGKGLTATLTLTMPDVAPQVLTGSHGCVYAAARERHDASGVTYFARGTVSVTVTNPTNHVVRNVALNDALSLEGDPGVRADC